MTEPRKLSAAELEQQLRQAITEWILANELQAYFGTRSRDKLAAHLASALDD